GTKTEPDRKDQAPFIIPEIGARRRLVAHGVVFVLLATTEADVRCRRMLGAGGVRPLLDEVGEDDAANHHDDGEPKLYSLGEGAEGLCEIGNNHVDPFLRYGASTVNVPTMPPSLWPGTEQ